MVRWLLLVLLCLTTACERGSNNDAALVRFDAKLQAAVEERATRALERPKASAAFDAWIEAVVADAHVLTQGMKLADRLMAEPAVAGAVETIMTKMGDDPQVIAALQELMAQNPGISPDAIGELFGQQFEKRWDTPAVSAEWNSAWDAFVNRLGSTPELDALLEKAMNRVLADIDSNAIDRRINARITELNGGKRPDPDRALQLYLDNAWSEPRVEDIAVKIVSSSSVIAATAKLVGDTLAQPDVTAALATHAARLAGNTQVQAKIVRGLAVLYAKDLDITAVRTSLQDLLTDAAIVGAVRELLTTFGRNDKIRALARDWYATVKKDAALRRDLDAFLTQF